jgi:hypothetical protein
MDWTVRHRQLEFIICVTRPHLLKARSRQWAVLFDSIFYSRDAGNGPRSSPTYFKLYDVITRSMNTCLVASQIRDTSSGTMVATMVAVVVVGVGAFYHYILVAGDAILLYLRAWKYSGLSHNSMSRKRTASMMMTTSSTLELQGIPARRPNSNQMLRVGLVATADTAMEETTVHAQARSDGSVDEDIRAFFTAPVVSSRDLEVVGPSATKALLDVVDLMETRGADLYLEYKANKKRQDGRLGSNISSVEDDETENGVTGEEDSDPLSGIDARSYQTALLNIAKEQNTIVHLGTGTG